MSKIAQPVRLLDNDKQHLTKAALRAREEGEVGGCEAKLTPPKELSPEARKEWKRVVRLYRQLDHDVINDLDLTLLASYCESVAVYKAAQVAYRTAPLVTEDGKESPYLRIMDTAGKQIAKAADQLCLSPVGRARMGVIAAKKATEKDPMEQWLQRKRSG